MAMTATMVSLDATGQSIYKHKSKHASKLANAAWHSLRARTWTAPSIATHQEREACWPSACCCQRAASTFGLLLRGTA
eukprot:scaffold132799_cov16-Tisochrysis_lutea.AAC.1